MSAIPVIALTGCLGAGKTSLRNHVLRAPDARVGVVINDFGALASVHSTSTPRW